MRKHIGVVLLVVVIIGVTITSVLIWPKRPPRHQAEEYLFQGVHYTRQVRSAPRPLMIHVVTIETTGVGIRFLVTPGEIGQVQEYRARTTTEFVQEYQVQVGINGGFFEPFYSHSPFNYYPHSGDLVDVKGLAISNEQIYSEDEPELPRLCISQVEIQIQPGKCGAETEQALAGDAILVKGGQILVKKREPNEDNLHPRTAVGIDEKGQMMWLVVVDGRQIGYSEGMTLYELAGVMVGLGADKALNLDGGGSSTLVVNRGEDIDILNAPYHTRITMRERPVANHLGVYAEKLEW